MFHKTQSTATFPIYWKSCLQTGIAQQWADTGCTFLTLPRRILKCLSNNNENPRTLAIC